MSTIRNHLNAGYPVLAVVIADDSAVIRSLPQHEVAVYSASQAICAPDGGQIQAQATWHDAFQWAAAGRERVIIVRDAQHVLSNAPIYRSICERLPALKAQGSAIVLVAPHWRLPAELAHVVPVIDWAMPSRDELRRPLTVVAESAGVELNGNTESLLDSAAGLTIDEAENAFALSVVESAGELDSAIVAREKMRTIAATGYLSVTPPVSPDDIGGLGELKAYLASEVREHCRDSQLAVRGILLAGVPGTGKSLSAKACGSVLGWPVVRLDVAACKGSLVGQSEANIRHATKLAEAISPCVVWIDEIEKAVGGYRSSASSDGGTTLGMVGHLLTWLQEHDRPIFTVATCNDYQALPAELIRAGRFDERFVVDLPLRDEREAIALVHLGRLNCSPDIAGTIADQTDRWTGAEIEQLVRSSARLSNREIDLDAISQAAGQIKPLAVTRAREIQEFRDWAKNTLRLANDREATPALGRRLHTAH